ncbi:MAG: hypothetical protein M3286_05505 [Thermoproteota archaeon]|nr:hypothetical protein [Thermoproteota archaeon]
MAKTSSTRRSSAKYDITIRAKATTTKIIDITNETLRLESNDKGQVRGKHYSGVHWDTVEGTILADGTASLTIRYLHVTNKGESIVGTGTGTQLTPNQRGVAKVTAEGTMWTSAPGLSHLNGGRWRVEGQVNTIRETVDIRGNFETTDV